MMHRIKNLSLYHFKNYNQANFDFQGRIICISGANGSGKTSILDAIYTLCFTKSYFIHSDSLLIQYGKSGMRINGTMSGNSDVELKSIIRENGKKEFSLNGDIYAQLSKHIGKYTCVMIAPDDTQLITEGSESRRKFIDILISQIDVNYMKNLIAYNKSLAQRNAYLKQLGGNLNELNESLVSIYNLQLVEAADFIFKQRIAFIETLKLKTETIYNYLSDSKEKVSLSYSSSLLNNELLDDLTKNIAKDVFSQRTNYGIHRDDLLFVLNEMPFKQVASQGQRKSFLFGLKLAQFEIIHESTSSYPILLLDDIFEKLDELRSRKLIDYVLGHHSQVFITDTDLNRLQQAFQLEVEDVQFIALQSE